MFASYISYGQGDKLDPNIVKCIFLGYSRIQKGYKSYGPHLHRKFIGADVTFHMSVSFYSFEGEKFQKDPFKYVDVFPLPGAVILEEVQLS